MTALYEYRVSLMDALELPIPPDGYLGWAICELAMARMEAEQGWPVNDPDFAVVIEVEGAGPDCDSVTLVARIYNRSDVDELENDMHIRRLPD